LTKKNVKSYEKNIAVVTLNGSAVQKIILKYFPHRGNVWNPIDFQGQRSRGPIFTT
jgi:hypothetical protein